MTESISQNKKLLKELRKVLEEEGVKYNQVAAVPIMGTDVWCFFIGWKTAVNVQLVCKKYCDLSKRPYRFYDHRIGIL